MLRILLQVVTDYPEGSGKEGELQIQKYSVIASIFLGIRGYYLKC